MRFGGTGETFIVDDFNALDILVFLGPKIQAGMEVLVPMGGQGQDSLYAVVNSDLSVKPS